jgi:hypothetical protein
MLFSFCCTKPSVVLKKQAEKGYFNYSYLTVIKMKKKSIPLFRLPVLM